MAKRRRKSKPKVPPAWTVDKNGRWRDERGRFASRAALLGRVQAGDPDEVGQMLIEAAARVKRTRGKKQDYIIVGRFDNLGWRTLSFAAGLSETLAQAGDWLQNGMDLSVNFYGEDPQLLEIEVRRVAPGKSKSLRKRKAKKGKK